MVVLQRHRLRRRFRANSRGHLVGGDVCIHTRRICRIEWVRRGVGKSTQAEATAQQPVQRPRGGSEHVPPPAHHTPCRPGTLREFSPPTFPTTPRTGLGMLTVLWNSHAHTPC